MSRGIVYIAFGEEYDKLASYTVALSAPNVSLPVTIITNMKMWDSQFAKLLPSSKSLKKPKWSYAPNVNFIFLDVPTNRNREIKTLLYKYSPYDETLYVDCDSVIVSTGIEKIFKHFKGTDLILQSNRTPTWSEGRRYFRIYRDAAKKFNCKLPLNIYQGGIFAFRKSEATKAFFDKWNEYWEATGSGRDMPSLACAVQNSGIPHSTINSKEHKFFVFGDEPGNIIIHPMTAKRLCSRFKIPLYNSHNKFDEGKTSDWDFVSFGEESDKNRTIAFIRLHSYNENPSVVWDAIGRYADRLYFLANNITDPSIIEAAENHPQCAGMRKVDGVWDNHDSLVECYKWADEIKPDFILTFDEDEIPPERFGEVFEQWKKTSTSELLFKCVWCYGDTETILKDYYIPFGYHMKACRWREKMWIQGVGNKCRLNIYKNKFIYKCEYPYRHLSVMTQQLREARKLRYQAPPVKSTPTIERICQENLKTIPYDANMKYEEWMKQAEKFEKKHQYD